MAEGKTDKFTWRAGDTVFEFEPNPDAKPIIAPEDMELAMQQLAEWEEKALKECQGE